MVYFKMVFKMLNETREFAGSACAAFDLNHLAVALFGTHRARLRERLTAVRKSWAVQRLSAGSDRISHPRGAGTELASCYVGKSSGRSSRK